MDASSSTGVRQSLEAFWSLKVLFQSLVLTQCRHTHMLQRSLLPFPELSPSGSQHRLTGT